MSNFSERHCTLVQLDARDFDPGNGVILRGLSGTVRLQGPVLDRSVRRVALRDCQDLEALDLTELPVGFWLDLGQPVRALRVDLPVGGASLRLRFSLDLPALVVNGPIKECLVHCLEGEDWHQTRGTYVLGPCNGIRFLRGVNFNARAETQAYVRVDQTGRGLQMKFLRGKALPDAVSWKLVEPSRIRRSPLGKLFAAGLAPHRFGAALVELDEDDHGDQREVVRALSHSMAERERAKLKIDPLKVLCLLAWDGVDGSLLWQIRCALRHAMISLRHDHETCDQLHRKVMFWPRERKSRFDRICLRYWDLQLYLLCHSVGSAPGQLPEELALADDLRDVAVLAELMCGLGTRHPLHEATSAMVKAAMAAVDRQIRVQAKDNDRQLSWAWHYMSRRSAETSSFGDHVTTVDLLLDMAPRLESADCLAPLCQMLANFSPVEERLDQGIRLLASGCRQGRLLIASALRATRGLSDQDRARAMEYLLSPVASVEHDGQNLAIE